MHVTLNYASNALVALNFLVTNLKETFMNTNNAIDRLSLFDISDYLLTGEDVSEYLRQVIADKDAEELVRALENIKRSVGMAEIHPGKILHKVFMKPRRITTRKLALSVGLTSSQIIEITAGRQPITSDIALRLGKFFSVAPSFWMNLKSEYDLRLTKQT